MNPKISVLLCTYNGKNYLRGCLDSILMQNERSFEVLCIDGGSTDGTKEIIAEYIKKDKRIKFIVNPNKLPEGIGNGKWLGFKKSKGSVIAIVDQDNVLQRKTIFKEAMLALQKEKNAFGVLGGLTHDKKDNLIVRYVSIFGTDSFFAYRSIDFLKNLNSLVYNKCNYAIFAYPKDYIYLTGGNCFFYRKTDLLSVGGYEKDVATVAAIISKGRKDLIILKDATKHYAEKSLARLALKKFKWGRSYFATNVKSFRYIRTKRDLAMISLNFMASLLLIPYILFSIYLYGRKKDYVVFLFPVHAFLNTLAYSFAAIMRKLFG